jgi:hypothetical protein
MTRRTGRHSVKSKQEEKLLLDRLSATLSTDEVRRVLAVAVLELDDGGRARLYRRVGEETSRALWRTAVQK